MCCFCTQDDIAEYYSEAMSSSEYLEIMELYADRLKGQIAAVQAQRNTLHIPLDMLGREHCFPLLDGDDIATGRRASQWERGDILGEVRPECLPQWAKDRLQVIQRERTLKRSLSDTR